MSSWGREEDGLTPMFVPAGGSLDQFAATETATAGPGPGPGISAESTPITPARKPKREINWTSIWIPLGAILGGVILGLIFGPVDVPALFGGESDPEIPGSDDSLVGRSAYWFPLDIHNNYPTQAQIDIDNLLGLAVLIVFLDVSGCPDCDPAVEMVNQIALDYNTTTDLAIIGVLLDYRRPGDQNRQFIEDQNITYPTGPDPEGVSEWYKINNQAPTTVVLSRDHRVVSVLRELPSDADQRTAIDAGL